MTAAILASKEQRPEDVIQKYTEAIAQYYECLASDPEQPAHLTNKAVAMKGRGIETFIMTVKSKTLDDAERTAKLQAAKNDFIAAAEAATAAVSLIKAQTPPTNFPELQRYNGNKYAALLARAEVMRMVVRKVDPSQAETGYTAFKEYMAVETDPARNSNAQLHLAQMLFEAEAIEKALVEFQVILRNQPDSLEANLGAGLALYAIGDTKAKLQEAAKYLQYFVDFAPDTNDIKAYAKKMLAELRDAEITTPERIKPSSNKLP
jgi:tetratricopeptide (TPR) repeat protein